MTLEEANAAIDEALSAHGIVEPVGEEYFQAPRFADVRWVPSYVRRVNGRIWAAELYRGDIVPLATVQAMVAARQLDGSVQPAFLVPEQPYDHLLPACREHAIALIAKVSDEYSTLIFPAPGVAGGPVIRIPDWLVGEVSDLEHLADPFRLELRRFHRAFARLVESGTATDETQEQLINRTVLGLLRRDTRFAGDFEPLNLLRFFERNLLSKGRDHYFHTFNNFLLGCLVIDRCYPAFQQFRQMCFLGTAWSPEYVWLLTVFFHDVGYPIQKYLETSEMIFGVKALTEEQAIAERKQAWESPPYVASRAQLIALYDYLTQDTIESDWTADPFPLEAGHPLDKAFEESFLKHGHGVASCMRMLAVFFRSVPQATHHRQFIVRHAFLSGLSIPFHDWPVRKFLRDSAITNIKTSRFPFASLLMFIDSIQEDRRGEVQEPDILRGITFNGNTAIPNLDLALLPPEKMAEKQREVRDMKSFLVEDLLRFEFPPQLTGG